MRTALWRKGFRWIVAVTLGLVSVNPLFAKRKDDVVIMNNGDRFTGEIKELRYGELIFQSDYMKDSVHLDWKRVQALQSKDTFIVELSDGERVTGTIGKVGTSKGANHDFEIAASGNSFSVSPSDVISIGQREASFWNQLTGSVNYGFGFASGNNSTNSSLGADVAYRTDKNFVQVTTTSQFDAQSNAKNTNRITVDIQYDRMLTKQWLATGLYSALKSNQQDLELRSTYGGGIGRKLIQTDKTSFTLIGGAAFSHESYVPQPNTEPVRNNAEALAGLKFFTFRFSKLELNSQTLLFQSLSDSNRRRVSSQSNLRIELVRNFSWNFQLYENYDTRPPISAPKNDLGITTSLGWTF